MTLQAKPVEQDHLMRLFRLKVTEAQRNQVASNEFTLAEAAYEPGSHVWGLWDEDQAVGLLAMIDPTHSNDEDVLQNPHAGYIWRLLIAKEFQSKGYGRQAIEIARNMAKSWGMSHVTLSFVDQDGGAEGFYLKCGFSRTGRVIDEELEMIATV